MNNKLNEYIDKNEEIIIKGYPSKNCFVMESIFNPMLIFAIILAIFDILVFNAFITSNLSFFVKYRVVAILLIHLIPVYIYIIGILLTNKKYKNKEYIITDKAIYVSKGMFKYIYEKKLLSDITGIKIYRGLFDGLLKVGDVVIAGTMNESNSSKKNSFIVIDDISNYNEVIEIIEELTNKKESKKTTKKKSTKKKTAK